MHSYNLMMMLVIIPLCLQIHLRGGTVIPMQKPGNTTTESRKNDYTLLVVLDGIGEASGDIFLDDGLSIDIKRYHGRIIMNHPLTFSLT